MGYKKGLQSALNSILHARGALYHPICGHVQGLEKYLMTKIYHKVFAVSELDRERDEALTMRMSALAFVEPKHLDIPELYHDEKSWILARKELHKINNYKVCAICLALSRMHPNSSPTISLLG